MAGDVSTSEVVALAERYFGEIAGGPAVPSVAVRDGGLAEEQRPVLEDRVHLPRLYVAWRSARQYTEEDAEMEMLAGVLGGGKTSRLYRRLVYEERVAQDVSAFQNGSELDGSFFVVVTAKPGVALARIEQEVREEVARLAREGVEAEERVRTVNHIESEMVRALERLGGFGGKADRLNEYLTFAGDPGYVTRDLSRYQAVTAERIAGPLPALWTPLRVGPNPSTSLMHAFNVANPTPTGAVAIHRLNRRASSRSKLLGLHPVNASE